MHQSQVPLIAPPSVFQDNELYRHRRTGDEIIVCSSTSLNGKYSVCFIDPEELIRIAEWELKITDWEHVPDVAGLYILGHANL